MSKALKKDNQPFSRQIRLDDAITCPRGCPAIMVVMEQILFEEGAAPRIWVACPLCNIAFRLMVAKISDAHQLATEPNTCVMNHRRHKRSDCPLCSEHQLDHEERRRGDVKVLAEPFRWKKKRKKS